MLFLRQSTASQEIQLGQFVDDTDRKTAETGLTIANTDIKLFKHGATSQASKNSGGATHMASGYYSAVLDATDTDTLGNLEVTVNVSGALAVRREYVVLDPVVYDSLVAASDKLQVDAVQQGGTTLTARDIGASVLLSSGTGTGQLDFTSGVVKANVTQNAGTAITSSGGRQEVDVRGHTLNVTTIATLNSQTSFTLTAGSADNDAYNGCTITILDASTAVQKCVGVVQDYAGASKTVMLRFDPAAFTMAVGDTVVILAERSLKSAARDDYVFMDGDGNLPASVNSLLGTGDFLVQGLIDLLQGVLAYGEVNDGSATTTEFDILMAQGGSTLDGLFDGATLVMVSGDQRGKHALVSGIVSEHITLSSTVNTLAAGPDNGDKLIILNKLVTVATPVDAAGVRSAVGMVSSAVNDGSATTTSFVTDLIEATDDHYLNAAIQFTSGQLTGQCRKISDYDGATKTITVSSAFTEAPGDGDEFFITGRLTGA